MEIVECKEVCAACPLGEGFEVEPEVIVELGWEASGTISDEGGMSIASFELRNGKPVGERTSTVSMGAEDEIGVLRASRDFQVSGSQLDSGEVTQAFKDCDEPTEVRAGFLWLRKKAVCSALQSLAAQASSR